MDKINGNVSLQDQIDIIGYTTHLVHSWLKGKLRRVQIQSKLEEGQVMSRVINWGFFGAGCITNDFVGALRLVPDRHRICAIASRSLERSKEFSKKFSIPKAYGSYKELTEDSEIDTIYVGTVNSEHYGNAKLAILSGKNVLVEKPLGINRKQVEELVALARERKVFLMEGFWTRFFPAFEKLQEILPEENHGEILQILINTGAPAFEKDRISSLELGGGSLMNYGVYSIMVATLFFGRKPNKILATANLKNGVDEASTFVISYPNGQTITAIIHTRCWMPREAHIITKNATYKFPCPYWAPTSLETPDGPIPFPVPPIEVPSFFPNPGGFIYEADHVRDCLIKGFLESPRMPLDESIAIYGIADEIRKQMGVVFPQDSQ